MIVRKMKVVIGVCLLVGLVAAKPQDTYTTKFDNIDLDEVLSNERLYKIYFNCLIDKGKCTEDGKILKESLPDALQNECKKCSQKQKEGSEKVIKYVTEKKPGDFKLVEEIYDPDGIYRKRYNKEAKERGIPLID